MHRSDIAARAGFGFAAMTAALCLTGGTAVADEAWDHRVFPSLIRPLLAPAPGGSVCFGGSFRGLAVNVWDYGRGSLVPVPGSTRFGKPVLRTEPFVHREQPLTGMMLQLEHSDLAYPAWDEMHLFRLEVRLEGWARPFRAAGECPLRFGERAPPRETWVAPVRTTSFYCGIDCDGGSFEVERVAGSGDLLFRFEADGGGLRMSSGCSGSEPFHLGGDAVPYDEASRQARRPVWFRLHPVPAEACRYLAPAEDETELSDGD